MTMERETPSAPLAAPVLSQELSQDGAAALFAHSGMGERYQVAPFDQIRARAETAALYRLTCSPHEWTEADGLAMAALIAAVAPRLDALQRSLSGELEAEAADLRRLVQCARQAADQALRHLERAQWQVTRLGDDLAGVNWDAVCGLMSGQVAAAKAVLSSPLAPGWWPISIAPRDGSVIWAVFKPHIYPVIRPERDDLERWNGLQLPMMHEGFSGEHDMGWRIRAPVGQGGFPDEWIAGWRPCPPPPASDQP